MSAAILAAPAPAEPPPAEQNTESVFSPPDTLPPLERLAAKWVALESRHTAATIGRGDLLHRYLTRQLRGRVGADRRQARGELVAGVVERLKQQGFDCNASRLLGIRAVAEVFGRSQAGERSTAALAELVPLLHRTRDSEDWEPRPRYQEASQRLWKRIVADHLGAPAIREAVAAIRNRPTLQPAASQPRKPSLSQLARHATEADVAEFVGALPDAMLDYLAALVSHTTGILPEIEPTPTPPPSATSLFRRLSG